MLRLILPLGITQIVGYGTLYYAFGVVAAPLTQDLGISQPAAFGAFSLALLAGGVAAPVVGRLIDRYGARQVMAAGSVGAAAALAVLSGADGLPALFGALVLAEVVSAMVLYDAAFAALAQGTGPAGARRAITLMTLIGGFASTVFWPVSLALVEALGWRGTYLVFAELHLLVCLPLHLSLQGPRAAPAASGPEAPPAFAPLPPERHRAAMIWLGAGFALSGVVLAAFAAQWVPVLTALGLAPAAAVAAGVVMGPAQVAVRVIDLAFGARHHPLGAAVLATSLLTLSLVILWLVPPGLPGAMAFALCFGMSSGLTSIVRGTVPLALFGAQGFGARLGTLAAVRLAAGAVAPFALSLSLAGLGGSATIALSGLVALGAVAALLRVPR